MSARIRARTARDAAKALFDAGLTTAARMADATWEERTRVLNESGYARYDERTSSMLGDTSRLLLDRYRGDLRRLREAANRDPAEERTRLEEFKGIGDVGVDIFFRDVQRAWTELAPFADRRALRAAGALGLGHDARALAGLDDDLPGLVNALVRADLDHALDEIGQAAERS